MAIRRRTWNNPDGSVGEAWVVDYRDQHRKRHLKAFKRRKDAAAHHARVAVEVRQGTHAAERSPSAWRRPVSYGSTVASRRGSNGPRLRATASAFACTSCL